MQAYGNIRCYFSVTAEHLLLNTIRKGARSKPNLSGLKLCLWMPQFSEKVSENLLHLFRKLNRQTWNHIILLLTFVLLRPTCSFILITLKIFLFLFGSFRSSFCHTGTKVMWHWILPAAIFLIPTHTTQNIVSSIDTTHCFSSITDIWLSQLTPYRHSLWKKTKHKPPAELEGNMYWAEGIWGHITKHIMGQTVFCDWIREKRHICIEKSGAKPTFRKTNQSSLPCGVPHPFDVSNWCLWLWAEEQLSAIYLLLRGYLEHDEFYFPGLWLAKILHSYWHRNFLQPRKIFVACSILPVKILYYIIVLWDWYSQLI